MKPQLHLTFLVSIFATLFSPSSLSVDDETFATTRDFERDYEKRFGTELHDFDSSPSKKDRKKGEELCNKALSNKTLQRYLLLSAEWEKLLGDQSMPLDFLTFDGEFQKYDWASRNNPTISQQILEESRKGRTFVTTMRYRESWEEFGYPIWHCASMLRGTDYFRLFTESGRSTSYQRGGCKDESSPFCKGRRGTYTRDKFDSSTGEYKKVTYWDRNANPLRTDFYTTESSLNPFTHHNGFLLFLLTFPKGEKALETWGEKVLDEWASTIPSVRNQLEFAKLEKDKDEDKETVSTEELVEETPSPPTNETIYSNVYRNFLRVKVCYEAREGYMSVLINSVQWSKAEKEFKRRKELSDLPKETIRSIEESIDLIFYPDKNQPKQPLSIADDLDATWADLSRKGTLPLDNRTKYFCDVSVSNLYDGEDNFPYPFGM